MDGNSQPFEERDDSGFLFPENERKTENHPHFTGKGMVDGQEVQISAWKKVSKAGNPYLSLSFRKWVPRGKQAEDGSGADAPFDF